MRPGNSSCRHGQTIPELSPCSTEEDVPGNTSPLKNPAEGNVTFCFLGPPSLAPGLPAQSLSSCQNLTPRKPRLLLGQQRQTRSPSAFWSLTSKRSESGAQALCQNRKLLQRIPSPDLCAGQHLVPGSPSSLYGAGRLLWPSGTEQVTEKRGQVNGAEVGTWWTLGTR